jgi:alanyl-tRNA synthetase
LNEIEIYQNKIEDIKKNVSINKIVNSELNILLSEINYFASIDNFIKIKKMYSKIKEIFDVEMVAHLKNKVTDDINKIKNIERKYSKSNQICYIICHNYDIKTVTTAMNDLSGIDKEHVFIGFNILDKKIQYSIVAAKSSAFDCVDIIKKINLISDGTGGGSKFYAQGGTNFNSKMEDVINLLQNNL